MSDENENITSPEESEGPQGSRDEAQIISELQEQVSDLTDKWKRTAADFENYKRRKETESKELMEYSKEMTVANLIPSLQSLEQVLTYAPNDDKYKDWLLGLKATITQLEKTMEIMGLVKIKTVDQRFDPSLHEALEKKDIDSDEIVKELQPGFMLNGKVIIPAKVVVGKIIKEGE